MLTAHPADPEFPRRTTRSLATLLLLAALVQRGGDGLLVRCALLGRPGFLGLASFLLRLGASSAGTLELLLVGELLAAAVLAHRLHADLRLRLRLGDLLGRGEVQRLQALPGPLGVDALMPVPLGLGAGGGRCADDEVLLAEGPYVGGQPVDE